MRFAIAVSCFVFVLSIGGLARAQLAPATAPPPWNPFLPQPQPTNQPYGQYAGPSTTQQQLQASDDATSTRGLEVAYVNVEGGGSYASFGSGTSTGGLALGVGAGARFVLFSLGARVRVAPYKDYTLMQFLGEAGFHVPIGMWDPYAKLRAGYGKTSDIGGSSVSVGGFDLGGAIGADYYLSAAFSIGIEGSGDALFFSPTGATLAGTAHVGLHFDL